MSRNKAPRALDLRPKPKTDWLVRRRREVMKEAGLEHHVAAEAIANLDVLPTTRQAITNTINGHFPSARIRRRLVEVIRMAFVQQGKPERAEEITLKYMGWPELEEEKSEEGRIPVPTADGIAD